ncbi:zonadhesin [Rhipicephalus sanguineus]|uniref:zonadhesin n=1 Tax=Rhipicephalus sanguineus TaxID=34632 RepID=UPI001893C167|nr:zonadhesin [Rhipicephalus sanguineus]
MRLPAQILQETRAGKGETIQIEYVASESLPEGSEITECRLCTGQEYITKMHREVFVLLVIGITFVGVHSQGRKRKCRPNEEFLRAYFPRQDVFCRPWLALPSEVHKLHWCVCKKGYVRNAWGVCINMTDCLSCKEKPFQDFNHCGSKCPLTCGKPIPKECSTECVSGCSCSPGSVLHPSDNKTCVPGYLCPPQCPRFSSFQVCTPVCEATCDQPEPRECRTKCHSGKCVCLPRFVKVVWKEQDYCVPPFACPNEEGMGESPSPPPFSF